MFDSRLYPKTSTLGLKTPELFRVFIIFLEGCKADVLSTASPGFGSGYWKASELNVFAFLFEFLSDARKTHTHTHTTMTVKFIVSCTPLPHASQTALFFVGWIPLHPSWQQG